MVGWLRLPIAPFPNRQALKQSDDRVTNIPHTSNNLREGAHPKPRPLREYTRHREMTYVHEDDSLRGRECSLCRVKEDAGYNNKATPTRYKHSCLGAARAYFKQTCGERSGRGANWRAVRVAAIEQFQKAGSRSELLTGPAHPRGYYHHSAVERSRLRMHLYRLIPRLRDLLVWITLLGVQNSRAEWSEEKQKGKANNIIYTGSIL